MTFTPNAAVAAIQFALETDGGIPFLRCWNEGDFDAIRREWPEAPEEVFIGADPMHPETRALLARYGQQSQPADPDAERYRKFVGAGLPITYLGEDYHDKDSLDAAIDATGEP